MLKKIIVIISLFGLLSSLFALDFKELAKVAAKEHKLILLSIERPNCPYCKKMDKEVFTPKENLSHIGKHYIRQVVKGLNVKLPYNLKAQYYPTNFIVDPKDLHKVDEFIGYMKAEDFISLLDLVYEQEVTN